MPDRPLFQPNNHSAWEVTWSPVDEAHAKAVRELLRSAYGWDTVQDIKKSGAWEVQSKNFRAVVEEDGVARTVLVKKNPAGHTVERLLLVERILSYLKSRGIPVPEILPAQDGSGNVPFDGTRWQVFSFLPGDHFRGTEEELAEVARWIARLHVAFADAPFTDEALAHGKHPTPWSPETFAGFFEVAAKKEDDVSRRMAWERTFLEGMIASATKAGEQDGPVRRQIVRNSLHPHDTLFVDEKLQAIIDFEETGVSELLRDAGNACHRFVRQYVVHQGKPWQEMLSQGVRIFLDAYQKENPLSWEELQMMPSFIVDELLRKLTSAMDRMATQEKPGTYEAEVLKFIDLLKEAEEVGKAIKQADPAAGEGTGS